MPSLSPLALDLSAAAGCAPRFALIVGGLATGHDGELGGSWGFTGTAGVLTAGGCGNAGGMRSGLVDPGTDDFPFFFLGLDACETNGPRKLASFFAFLLFPMARCVVLFAKKKRQSADESD